VAYVYPQADSLDGLPYVGDQQCVALVEKYAKAPAPTALRWKQGATVRGLQTLAKGTAIATFVDGKYPSHATGNHAALYLSQDKGGIWVIDQYRGSRGIHKRYLRFQGKFPNGQYIDASNNGDAFSVIE
jgi:hypothetical protein